MTIAHRGHPEKVNKKKNWKLNPKENGNDSNIYNYKIEITFY
jgi:hypothetical protein